VVEKDMVSTQTPPLSPLASLSEHDRFLVKATEDALRDGLQLERWARDPGRKIREFPLLLYRPFKKPFTLKNEAFGYFADVQIGERALPAVGLRQKIQFSKICPPNPEQKLMDFVLCEFMPRAHWTYEDGYMGGFTIESMLYRTVNGEYGKTPPAANQGCVDWRELGKKYEWVLITIRLYDFVVNFGPWLKRLNEAVAVVLHRDFMHIVEKPAPGYKLEVSIGYPFIAFAPIPNFFGFGPGKFDWAVKLFSFLLTDNNEVVMTMDFVAGRRPSKVFDFGKYIPDPVYGGAALLNLISFGLWSKTKFHDKMDGEMMRQHGRVHQSLADGVAKIWEEWVQQNCDKP
jgi:hypothetical protein